MLTNKLRIAFGIKELLPEWSKIPLKGLEGAFIYYDDNRILQKYIKEKNAITDFYSEIDYSLQLDDELKVVGKKGKVQKLSYSVLEKFKPACMSLYISSKLIRLINENNGIQLFEEYNPNLESQEDILQFLNNRLTNQTEYEKEEFNQFLDHKKQKPQTFKSGDIFRYKLAERKFAYGRVICDIRKLININLPVDQDHPVDSRGSILFDKILYPSVWIDYFVLITDNPHLKFEDLKNIPTTFSVIQNAFILIYHDYKIVGHSEIENNSYDVPMEWDTYYQTVPITEIFKWGMAVKLFKPDGRLENQREKIYPMNYHPIYMYNKEATEYYIRSFINNKPDFRATTMYGDLRESLFSETRQLLSENIGFNIDSGDYDAFAKKYGFMTKEEILKYCE